MARQSTKVAGSGNSKIRFIMLEAELNDGNLSQITQAISNALNKSGVAHRLVAAPVTNSAISNGGDVDEAQDEVVEEVAQQETSRVPRKPRKISVPKVLVDVDLNSGDMPFAKFAEGKAPTSDLARHLVVAYWFKAYRQVNSVSIDHVYTCYKKVGWSTDIKDFAQPFRDVQRQQGRGEFKGGLFTINHLGEDAVEKMPKK